MSHPRRGFAARAASIAGFIAGFMALLALLAGCTGETPGAEPAGAPESPSTPLASYDTTAVTVVRAPYCERVPEAATEEALAAPPRRVSAYDNGDPVKLDGDGTDVAHEYGCHWAAGTGRARTWLFAPPVSGDRARDLVREARSATGCVPDEQAPAFGTPSVALVCGDERVTVSYRGLFGDAWLVCELTGRGGRAELVDRADRWCVQVVEAVRADAG